MNDVVAAPVRHQVPEHARPEDQGREDAAPAGDVELHAGPHRDHADALHLGSLSAGPLAQRQEGDLVALGRQPLSQVPVPALGPPDRVGVQAVIDQADAHGAIPCHAPTAPSWISGTFCQ